MNLADINQLLTGKADWPRVSVATTGPDGTVHQRHWLVPPDKGDAIAAALGTPSFEMLLSADLIRQAEPLLGGTVLVDPTPGAAP